MPKKTFVLHFSTSRGTLVAQSAGVPRGRERAKQRPFGYSSPKGQKSTISTLCGTGPKRAFALPFFGRPWSRRRRWTAKNGQKSPKRAAARWYHLADGPLGHFLTLFGILGRHGASGPQKDQKWPKGQSKGPFWPQNGLLAFVSAPFFGGLCHEMASGSWNWSNLEIFLS